MKAFWAHARHVVLPLAVLLILTTAWEVSVRLFNIPEFLLPAPSQIWTATAASGQIMFNHTLATFNTTMLGFLVSVLVSLPLAIAITSSPLIANAIYPLLVLTGLLPWQLFSAAFSNASGSLVSNTHLISKVYFPRLIVPLSSVAVALIDFCIVMGLLVTLFLWWQFMPDWRVLLLPLFILLTLVTAIGTGLWLTALTVKYRDFRYVVPFMLQVGLFLSPVGFSSTNLPNWRALYSFNPMVGAIDGFRWCLLRGAPALDPLNLAVSIGMAALLLASGLWYFRRTERTFADVI